MICNHSAPGWEFSRVGFVTCRLVTQHSPNCTSRLIECGGTGDRLGECPGLGFRFSECFGYGSSDRGVFILGICEELNSPRFSKGIE